MEVKVGMMRLEASQQTRTEMRLRMAPRMIQSMEILQLPLMALQERIDQELTENIALVDLRENPTAEADPDEPQVAEPESEPEPEPEPADREEFGPDDWPESYGEAPR